MTTFALITEGITDQVILEHMLGEFYDEKYKEQEEPDIHINPIQPARDDTDASRASTMGGWERVLEHCSHPDIISSCLSSNDFVIIQIDTDCCEHVNFGVSLTVGGIEREFQEIIEDTKELLISKIGKKEYIKHKDRFIFAICVHSLECWLMPFHTRPPRKRTKSCEKHLALAVIKGGGAYAKEYDCYKKLAKPIKGRDLVASEKNNDSLGLFLTSLPEILD